MAGTSDRVQEAHDDRWIERDERVVSRLTGLGATLVVTTHRLVLVRDGAGHRPRSGVRAWRPDAINDVLLLPPKHGQARIVVRTDAGPDHQVSMFFAADEWPNAARLVGEVRRLSRLDRPRR